jgi:hypothetical protein
MAQLTVPEILDKADKEPTREGKLNVLRKYTNEAVKLVLLLNFHPTVRMDLPEGAPPFKRDDKEPVGYSNTNLLQEVHRFYVWIKKDVNINKIKKEALFQSMLESIHHTEADVLILAKDQKLTKKYKTIKEDIVRDLYPGLLPEKKPKQPKTSVEEQSSEQPLSE